jgi:predicted ATPase
VTAPIVSRASVPRELCPPASAGWPFDLGVVRQLAERGIAFDAAVTFLVGENGSGKSTIVEAIAEAYGADVRGGHVRQKYSPSDAKGPLGSVLRLELDRTGARRPRGFFLRAETAYGVFEFMSEQGVPGYGDQHLLHVSHGESFLQVFGAERFSGRGLFLLDEPEAALSFTSCLSLLEVLHRLASEGAQVICATHSPVLSSLPGASILELSDDHGIRAVAWDELSIVDHWRRYLADPSAYLRHLL